MAKAKYSDTPLEAFSKVEALEATLDALASAVYLTDRQGRVVFMNRAAERQAKTSSALHVKNSRLTPVDHPARVALAEAIAENIANEADIPTSGFSLALPDGENSGLIANILPLTRGERRNFGDALEATSAVFVQDPVVVAPLPGAAFAKLYDLTGSELRVLLAMAPGLGTREVADVLGICETTTKTHLHHIYAKTRTSKQTELMHLFRSSAPPIGTM